MRKTNLHVLLLMAVLVLGLVPASALDYSVGDSFSLEITTELTGETQQYSGYRETEEDKRTYTVLEASSSQVNFEMIQDYSFWNNEDSSLNFDLRDKKYLFSVDPEDNSYLDDTKDGDSTYFTFDYIWFRVDPTISVGDEVRILGYDYVYKGTETIKISTFTAIKTMKLELKGGTQSKVIDDPDYEPLGQGDGIFPMSFTETFWFDMKSGYIVKGEWQATCDTSVGRFSWDEKTILTDYNFAVQTDIPGLIAQSMFQILLVIAAIAFLVLYPRFQKSRWRKEVETSIQIISNQYSEPVVIPSDAPTIWDPLTLDYKELLADAGGNQKLMLKDGIYVITDTNHRLVLADVNTDRYLPSHVMNLKDDNLKLLYRISLGMVDYNSQEHGYLSQHGANLNQYMVQSQGFALPDRVSMGMYWQTSQKDPNYQKVSDLVARRKVLDYSHGQAPLTPEAHLRKFNKVMQFSPNRVFMVGDDDLVSVTLARHGVEVTLVEIDPYTCALISGLANLEKLPISIHQVDLRNPLPDEIPADFDLFVADPDFTIEAFALFLSRGLSKLRIGGIGLINFENRPSQRFKADYLLSHMNVEVVEREKEPWSYVILQNQKRAVGTYYSGKYAHVDYARDIVLSQASYSSVMFVVRRTHDSNLVLRADQQLEGPSKSIYDY